MAKRTGINQHSKASSSRERAYLYIQQKVVSGELSAGQVLSEPSISKHLGISRTPVREALGQLAREGLLEQRPNSRTVVASMTRQDIVDLYELREALEVYAVGKVARQLVRKVDLNRLQSLNDAILPLKEELERSGKSELDGEQMRRFVTYDMEFHTLLMRLAANARIMKIVKDTRLLIIIFAMRQLRHTAALLESIHRHHSEIIRAISDQDPQGAMYAISEHIQVSMHERLGDFDQWELENSLHQTLPLFLDVRRKRKPE